MKFLSRRVAPLGVVVVRLHISKSIQSVRLAEVVTDALVQLLRYCAARGYKRRDPEILNVELGNKK